MKTILPISIALAAAAHANLVADAAADFSLSSNPNGLWSYGYSLTLGSPLIPHVDVGNIGGLDYWRTNLGSGVPGVGFNPTPFQIVIGATAVLDPGTITLHPGPGNEYSLMRYSSPSAGQLQIEGSFFGQDNAGTSTDVHILQNGVSVFDSVVNGFGPTSATPFNLTLTLNANDILDFAVGAGPGGNYFFDSTGLSAAVNNIPEPGSASLLLLGSLALAGFRRQRHGTCQPMATH